MFDDAPKAIIVLMPIIAVSLFMWVGIVYVIKWVMP